MVFDEPTSTDVGLHDIVVLEVFKFTGSEKTLAEAGLLPLPAYEAAIVMGELPEVAGSGNTSTIKGIEVVRNMSIPKAAILVA